MGLERLYFSLYHLAMSKKTLCPLPWNFIAVRNNGDYRICCQANLSSSQGLVKDSRGDQMNARDSVVSDVRNAPLMKQTRLDMLDGVWPEPCVRCKQEEASGMNSRRIYETEKWGADFKELAGKTKLDGSIDTITSPVKYFDVRFGNKCNLACRMCGPTDSDFWYADHVKLTGQNYFKDTHGIVQIREKNRNRWKDIDGTYSWYESDTFWQELLKNSNSLVHIYLAGGEPLLIEEHYTFLEKLISLGIAKNVCLEYNTNASVLPSKALELWPLFKKVRLGLSIDGAYDVLEYQRYPAKWPHIERNIRKVNEIAIENIEAWLACTVTVYNAFHLPQFIDWKLKANLNNINTRRAKPIITYHMAHGPKHLNVRVLSHQAKEELRKTYRNSIENLKEYYDEHLVQAADKIYQGILDYACAQSYHGEYWDKFNNFTLKLDKIRNQDITKILPPIVMEEVVDV